MLPTIVSFFKPPQSDSFELDQKSKFLHITLLVISGACVLLGFLNRGVDTDLGIVLFALGGISLFCVPLNKHGYYKLTALFVSALLIIIITYSMIEGVGLRDAGMVAFPLFIIYTTFLFNRNVALFATLLSMGAATFVYYLGQWGMLNPANYTDEANLKVLLILIFATGAFFWAFVNSWERVAENLRDTYNLTLVGWAKALEYRDHETEGHSQRVIDITLKLAQHLGISSGELHHIRRGALLHDIGKMAVPDSILLKNGSLTDDEWAIMKTHPVKAKELLKDIPFLKSALVIPYSHHERWDGSGYPDGLSKDAIPFAARIFAVVDVWDALNSDRPYRKAWPEEKVRAYLQEEAGKTLDPKIVQCFLEFVI